MVYRPLAAATEVPWFARRSRRRTAHRLPGTVGAGGVRSFSVVGLRRFAPSPTACTSGRRGAKRGEDAAGAGCLMLRMSPFSAAPDSLGLPMQSSRGDIAIAYFIAALIASGCSRPDYDRYLGRTSPRGMGAVFFTD